jgi:ligand-binding SRPBCC domain-containing protein
VRRFRHRFQVAAPLAEVAAFHRKPRSLKAVTPPLIPMFFKDLPEEIGPGQTMAFTLWMGPLPVRWKAALDALPEPFPEEEGFQDRQVEGPFAEWTHRHRFQAAEKVGGTSGSTSEKVGGTSGKVGGTPVGTWVIDEIDARLPPFRRHPLRWFVALQMWFGLPLLFAYRRWRTRQLLGG